MMSDILSVILAMILLKWGVDNLHEDAGGKVLSPFFPAEVTEPIRLHVAAKKYLCATDSSYYARLSKHPSALGATRRRNERERIA